MFNVSTLHASILCFNKNGVLSNKMVQKQKVYIYVVPVTQKNDLWRSTQSRGSEGA